MKYKRYIWFHFPYHDCAGGLQDIRGSFDRLDEAIAAEEAHPDPVGLDSAEIVDRDTWEVVWQR